MPLPVRALAATFFVFLFWCNACGQTDWTDDLDYLKSELPHLHTDLFHLLPKEEFDEGIEQLKKLNGKITDEAMAIKIQQLICKVGDAHTSVYFWNHLDKTILPFYLYFYKEGLFITGEYEDNESMLGHKLLKINGHPLAEIIDSMSTLMVIQGENSIKANIPNLITSLPLLLHFGFVKNDKKVEIETENYYGIPTIKKITPRKVEKLDYEEYSSIRISRRKEKRPTSKKNFDFVYKKESETLYFIYNRARGRETDENTRGFDSLLMLTNCHKTVSTSKPSYPPFAPFADSLISVMQTKPLKKLVIDLSQNRGGSISLANSLFQKMKSLLKDKPKAKVIVIIGRKTGSAAIIHAIELKRNLNAIVIGEHAGSKVNFFGGVDSRYLLGTCLKIYFSRGFVRNVLDAKQGNEVFAPDIILEDRFVDDVSGLDPVYEWIKNH